MKAKDSFPLTVSKGSVSVKIYLQQRGEYCEYKVAFYKGGVRKMKTFADLAEAKAQADKVIEDILKGEESTLLLKGAQKSAYERAMGFSRQLNMPIDLIAERYAQLVEKLGPVPPMDAAEYYQRRHPLNMPNKTVREVVDTMLSAKAKDGASAVYLRDLRFRLGEFADAFRIPIANIDAPIINEWLRGLDCSGRTRNNVRAVVATLFKFAEVEGFLPVDHIDFANKVPKAKEAQQEIEIFTVDEMTALLRAAQLNPADLDPGYNVRYATRQGLLPLLVLGGFAGMRTAEITRQLWSDINTERGFIRVSAAKGHTAQKRLIPITPNLKAWLAVCRKEAPTCCDYPRPFEAIQRLAERAKTEWKHNALRHSYISYRLAETTDAPRVSLEAGNSVRMIIRHYRELVTPEQAKAWFSIFPPPKA